MSGGGGGGGSAARVPIPASTRKIIQNLKEIASNHSEDEIYAMYKECAMDPNETVQKLLLQDHFHEVKRKRDKRKEVVREPADPRWRPGGQGRGGRGGRGNFSSRYVSNDVGIRNKNSGKENGINQGLEKGNISLSSTTSDTGFSSASDIVHGPSNTTNHMPQVADDSSKLSREENSAETSKLGTVKMTHTDVKNVPTAGQSLPTSDSIATTKTSSPVSGVYASTSDPVLEPSLDMHKPGEVGTVKRVVGSQWTVTEMTHKVDSHDIPDLEPLNLKNASDASSSYAHGKQRKSQGSEANHLLDAPQVAVSSASSVPVGNRSSNYSSRQQINGLQKGVVATKEWKPKPAHANPIQESGVPDTAQVPVAAEAVSQPQAVKHSISLEETTSKLEKRLNEVHLDRQHVIIPNHLQVPEAETHGLSFGSFDAGFKLNVDFANGPASDRSPTPTSETSQDDEENVVEQSFSSINTESTAAPEIEHADHPASSTQMAENYSSKEAGVSNIPALQEYDQAKQEPTLSHDSPPISVAQTTSTYSTFGLVPQMLGGQLAPFDGSEAQARDNTRIPSFVVQPPFDPSTAYYTQIYRPTADADGRFSPFLAPGGGSAKYNGSIAVLSTQTGHSPQESGNSVVLSAAGSTPIATQAAGVMQSSLTIPQQPVPVFRQPPGLHISPYPPNYIPYNQYLPSFYVQPPALHHYLSNAAFPQQPPAGSVYPPPGVVAATTPVKYSLPQYKPGTNNGSSAITGMPTSYGSYNSNPAGYTSSAVVTSGNSNGNEDLSTSQFKENNVYLTGQQSEGPAIWFPAPGRDMSSLQASSFYGIPPQGQHMAFAPTQVGHGAFSGVYHPAPAVATATVHPLLQQSQTVAGAVEMVGPTAGVYQQPQRGQMNWSSNY